MDNEKIIRYIEIENNLQNAAAKGENYKLTDEQKAIMDEVNKKRANDPKLNELIGYLFGLPAEERLEYLKNAMDEENKVEKEDTVEEAIAKTFDIDVSEINHHFLQNGKEVFSFYSNTLDRNVVLESSTKGKSLVDVLKELQEEVSNDQENNKGDDILVDESKRSNIELEMLSKDEILNNPSVFDSLAEEEETILRYLIANYENLQIQGINVENMIFITKDGKIKEATFKDNKIAIAEPLSEGGSEYEQDSVSEDKSSELNAMFADENENDNDENKKYEDIQFQQQKVNEYVKQKTFSNNNSDGFINDVFYVFLAVLTIVLTTIFIIGL